MAVRKKYGGQARNGEVCGTVRLRCNCMDGEGIFGV
jgi:hypothetical protein